MTPKRFPIDQWLIATGSGPPDAHRQPRLPSQLPVPWVPSVAPVLNQRGRNDHAARFQRGSAGVGDSIVQQ